jgi:hypothetical protein
MPYRASNDAVEANDEYINYININYINVYIYNTKPNHTTTQQTRRFECAIGQTLGEKITPIYPKHLWGDFTKSYNFGRFLTL